MSHTASDEICIVEKDYCQEKIIHAGSSFSFTDIYTDTDTHEHMHAWEHTHTHRVTHANTAYVNSNERLMQHVYSICVICVTVKLLHSVCIIIVMRSKWEQLGK